MHIKLGLHSNLSLQLVLPCIPLLLNTKIYVPKKIALEVNYKI